VTSQGQRFRRRALRRGYKVDEVDSFLDRVEQTLAGDPHGAPVTAQEVHDVVFRVRFGGYDEWQVDLHLDRVERQIGELEERGGFGRGMDSRMGHPERMGHAPERMGPPPMRDDRPMPPPRPVSPMPGPDPYGRYDEPTFAGGYGDRGDFDDRDRGGFDDRDRGGFDDRDRGGFERDRGGFERDRGGYDTGEYERAGAGFDRPGGYEAPGGYDVPGGSFDGFEPGRHGKMDMTAEIRMPDREPMGRVPSGPPMSGAGGVPQGDLQRIDILRRTFQPRRFGSGYDPVQVDRLFEGIINAMAGRGPMPISEAELDNARFGLVPGGYFEAEVDAALKEVRDILRRH
jgi:DivIVA domain-containing protein